MFENPYIEKLNDLVERKAEYITVEASDFMVFREAWLHHPKRKQIVGTAGLNGIIVYRFQAHDQKE